MAKIDRILITILLVSMTLLIMVQDNKIDVLQEQVSQMNHRMAGYEERTTDALDNWDSMRKTQLVLMDLLNKKY